MIVQVLSFYQLQASRSFYSTERFMSTEIYNFTNSSSSIRLPFLSFLILAVICQIVTQNYPNFSRTIGATKRHACQRRTREKREEKGKKERKKKSPPKGTIRNKRRREQQARQYSAVGILRCAKNTIRKHRFKTLRENRDQTDRW